MKKYKMEKLRIVVEKKKPSPYSMRDYVAKELRCLDVHLDKLERTIDRRILKLLNLGSPHARMLAHMIQDNLDHCRQMRKDHARIEALYELQDVTTWIASMPIWMLRQLQPK